MRNVCAACAIVMLSLIAAPSAALDRLFPPNASRGELKAHEYPLYKIGNRTYRMSPGGRIFSQQNLIMMPVSCSRPADHVCGRHQRPVVGDLVADPGGGQEIQVVEAGRGGKKNWKRKRRSAKEKKKEEKKKKEAAGSSS
jgi:hypothetical protein